VNPLASWLLVGLVALGCYLLMVGLVAAVIGMGSRADAPNDVHGTDDWHAQDTEAAVALSVDIANDGQPLWDAAELAALRAQCAADAVAARRVGGGL
jgi:hypothetical protein